MKFSELIKDRGKTGSKVEFQKAPVEYGDAMERWFSSPGGGSPSVGVIQLPDLSHIPSPTLRDFYWANLFKWRVSRPDRPQDFDYIRARLQGGRMDPAPTALVLWDSVKRALEGIADLRGEAFKEFLFDIAPDIQRALSSLPLDASEFEVQSIIQWEVAKRFAPQSGPGPGSAPFTPLQR